jgi:protein required for attachment to host cells
MKTWIVVADAAHARALESRGPGKPLRLVPAFAMEQELPPAHELDRERPSRTHESVGEVRHGIEPRTNARRMLKRRFAAHVAEKLEVAHAVHAFDRLVLVAPPEMMGDLRRCLSKSVAELVIADVAKDLVKVPDKDVRQHLDDVVGI